MKKLLSIALVVVLLAGIAVSGTMAYLQDSDSDVNVMTLGNVDIKQHEYERVVENGTYKTDTIDSQTSYVLQPFTQFKPLLPIVGDPSLPGDDPEYAGWDETTVRMSQVKSYGGMQVFAGKNAQDKFVTVENTGRTDAYVRTIIAFELGGIATDRFAEVVGISSRSTEITDDFGQPWYKNEVGVVEIDGNNYVVVEYVYHGAKLDNGFRHENGVLPAGDTTYPSLAQVYLGSDATNEDVEKLDGNKNGTYDILVLSQAVQASGFEATTDKSAAQVALDTAFGVANAANAAEWFMGEDGTVEFPKPMGSYEDFIAVCGDSGNHVLSDDITLPNTGNNIYFRPGTDNVIDLNGKTLDGGNGGNYFFIVTEGSMHLKGEGTVNMGKGFFASGNNSEIIIDGGTYNATNTGSLNEIKHCSLAQSGGKIVINGGTFTTNVEDAVLFFATYNARIEINGGFFENTVNETPDLLGIGTNKYNTNRIIITGGTFVNYNPLDDKMCYTGEWPAAGEAVFGGPWILIPGGYKVVSETQSNGDVWYTVVPK